MAADHRRQPILTPSSPHTQDQILAPLIRSPRRSLLPRSTLAGPSRPLAATRRFVGTSSSQVRSERESTLPVDSPPTEPPEAVSGLPVLTTLDLAGRKVLAIVDRLEAPDYSDLHALAGVLGRQTRIEAALSMDAGLRTSHIADALERVTSILDRRFPASTEEQTLIKTYFTDWAAELRP